MGGWRTEAWGGLRVDNCLVRVPIANVPSYRRNSKKFSIKKRLKSDNNTPYGPLETSSKSRLQ